MHLDMQSAIPSYEHVISAVEIQVKNIAAENVEGEGAKEIAMLWSSKEPAYGRDSLLARLKPFLPLALCCFVEENWERLLAEGKLMQEEVGSSDDEGDAHNQDWRADILGVRREERNKVRQIEGPKERLVNPTGRLLLTDGKETMGGHRKPPQMSPEAKVSKNGKRGREEGELSTSHPAKKKRIKSPEYITIPSSPSPPRSISRTNTQEFISPAPIDPLPAEPPIPSTQTTQPSKPTSPYKDKAKELRSKIKIAKRKSSAGSESAISMHDQVSRLSAAWSQSAKVVSSSSLDMGSHASKVNVGESDGTRSVTPSQLIEAGLSPSIDLDQTRALLNRLIAEKGHWVGLTCVGSQSQSQ
jgi:hypothetical protein